MTRSKSIWLAALLIAAWGGYLTQWTPIGPYGAYDYAWLVTVFCITCWISAIGLVMDRRWAGNLVYFLVTAAALAILAMLASDRPLLPYLDVLSNVVAYIPLAIFIAINLFLVVATHRHFGRRAKS